MSEQEESELKASYFVVGSVKLGLLAICTFGIYELYWQYKNWAYIRDKEPARRIMPFWRAVFAGIWCFSLSSHINKHGADVGADTRYPVWLIGSAYLLLLATSQLPDPFWLLSIFSFIPLLSIQNLAARIGDIDGSRNREFERFNAWNWVGIVLGGILLSLVLLGTFLPAEYV